VAKDTAVFFVDNDKLLAGEEKYFIDIAHYTLAGVKKVAENFAEFIISQELIK
jgi:hypothetical protein